MATTGDYDHPYRIGAYLLDCACDALALTDGGCPDRRCLVPGAEAEVINCCGGTGGGQLTITLSRIYSSRQFPDQDTSPSNCDAPWTVVVYEVEIWRCAPVGDVEFAPTCDELDDATLLTWTDVVAVRSGITCCLRDEDASAAIIGHGYSWLLGDHFTLPNSGGCAGSRLSLSIGYPTCWECP